MKGKGDFFIWFGFFNRPDYRCNADIKVFCFNRHDGSNAVVDPKFLSLIWLSRIFFLALWRKKYKTYWMMRHFIGTSWDCLPSFGIKTIFEVFYKDEITPVAARLDLNKGRNFGVLKGWKDFRTHLTF